MATNKKMWFNPTFSKNVKTNIARDFVQLIDKHFPPNNELLNVLTDTTYAKATASTKT